MSVPSAQDAQTLAGKPAGAFLASDKQMRTGVIALAQGETKTVASNGPVHLAGDVHRRRRGQHGPDRNFGERRSEQLCRELRRRGPYLSTPGSPATVFNASDSGSPLHDRVPDSPHWRPAEPRRWASASSALNVLDADGVVNGILWP